MLVNRSLPNCPVIPELAYRDIGKAIEWLTEAFGLTLRVRIADHRAQMKNLPIIHMVNGSIRRKIWLGTARLFRNQSPM